MAATTAMLPHVDELVMEYLLFRGFTRSFQALAVERKRDRAKAFDVEQLISQLLVFVETYQLEPILDSWKFLEARFFSRLDGSYTATIRQLEDSWLRLYVVNAIKTGHRDKAVEFFKLLADKLNASYSGGVDSWHRWFILPYVQNPESDPYFRRFFEKQWVETLITSFRNFLSLIFRNLPLPKLLAFQVSRLEEPSLKLRLKTSQSECNRLRALNTHASERIRKLEEAGHQLFGMIETMVYHSFAEHFSETSNDDDESSSPTVLKVLQSLSAQLHDLENVFGVKSNDQVNGKDVRDSPELLDPLEVKLNAVPSPPIEYDQDIASASAVLSSSPSSSSLQSAESPSSGHKDIHLAAVVEATLRQEDDESRESICQYSHDGKLLLVGHKNGQSITVFDVDATGKVTQKEQIQPESRLLNVEWIAESECVVYALQDGSVHVWDAGTHARTFIISYNADERRPTHLACARSSPVGAVALASENDAAKPSRVQILTFEDQEVQVISSIDLSERAAVKALRWASNGSVLAVTHVNGCVSILSPTGSTPMVTWPLSGDESPCGAFEVTPDGKSIVSVSSNQVVETSIEELVEAADSDPRVPPSPRAIYEVPVEMVGDGSSNRQLEFGLSGTIFILSTCLSISASVSLIKVYSRGRRTTFHKPVEVAGSVIDVAVHPRGDLLTAVTSAGKLHTWKLLE